MKNRKPFVLPDHPDSQPHLDVERGPAGDGVGWWVPEVKYTCLAKLIDGTRKAQAKFRERVLIDPFCGPGRIQVRGDTVTRHGGALVAWHQSVASRCPFTRVLVGDVDPKRSQACEARLADAGAPVHAFSGLAVETVVEMADRVPAGALSLAYLDPYNLEYLSFSIIERLARLSHVDFAVHFSLMDLTRNVDMELDPERDRFSGANPGWRHRLPPQMSKANLAAWFFDDWRSTIHQLGFSMSKEMPLVTDGQGRALYRLVFFSRHPFPDRIWSDIARDPTRPLFD